MSTKNKIILIMAGGTGGHILPALAVAKALQKIGVTIHWLGTSQGLENQLVSPSGIFIHHLNMQGIRGKGLLALLIAPFRLSLATLQAIRVIHQIKPNIVLGFGGYVSAPGGLAAWLLRKTLTLHEQNAILGSTNRYLSRLASQVFQTFPNTFPASLKAITCGNPIREEILAIAPPEQRFKTRWQDPNAPLRILILGGSQGAAWLNEIIPQTILLLPIAERPEIWHSAGQQQITQTRARYESLHISARVSGFIADMAQAYAWADVVICRAGASTVSEIMAVGVASILIPYPHAIDDHQTKNARYLADRHAAIWMSQHQCDSPKLAACLSTFYRDKHQLFDIAMAAKKLAMTDTAQVMISQLFTLTALNDQELNNV